MHAQLRNTRRFTLAVLVFLAPAAIAVSGHANVVDRIVAIVNGDAVTLVDVEQRTGGSGDAGSKRAMNELEREGERRQALNDIIDDVLLRQAIEKADIQVSDDELMRAIKNIMAQNGMTGQELRAEIARKGMTYEQYQDQVRFEIKKIKFINQVISTEVKITDRDLRDYFQEHKESFRGGKEVRLAEIVLPIGGIASEEEAVALRNLAISIAQEAQQDPAAFERLARKHSRGPNAEEGGDLGVVRVADLPPRVAQTIKNLPAGMVSQPIPTQHAVVIAKVLEWPTVSEEQFDSVRDTIYQRLHEERIDSALESYVRRLRQHAYIEIK